MAFPGWYAPLLAHRSKGSQAARPGSLAGLAAARAEHAGQFFTPEPVVACIWRLLQPALDNAFARDQAPIALLDNSVGSGRLLALAQPDRHTLAGVDPDAAAVTALEAAASAAGFDCDFIAAGMEDIAPRNFGVALINPPFSLHLESPLLEPYECTHYGRFGPGTSALSHEYALAQALAAASLVVAVLPLAFAEKLESEPWLESRGRLRAVVRLPAGAFRAEGTDVEVALAVFGAPAGRAPQRLRFATLADPWPDLGLDCPTTRRRSPHPLDKGVVLAEAQTVPGVVTGDPRVRIVKQGRYIGLRFWCALVHAKVLNGLLRAPVDPGDKHRYPRGIEFGGQGQFDLELYLAQPDPLAAFGRFLRVIEEWGGRPEVDASLQGYLRRAARRVARESTPFPHMTQAAAVAESGRAVARRARVLDPDVWGSPLLEAGTEVAFSRQASGRIGVKFDGQVAMLESSRFAEDFRVLATSAAGGWRQAFPEAETRLRRELAAARSRLRETGADRVASWDYQLADVAALRVRSGAAAAWRMGLGKSRLAIALCLAGGRCNAIMVEAQLVDEMVRELRACGLPESDWQVVRSVAQCRALRRINVISYHRLRAPVVEGAGRRTYARLLRRRFATVCADEAHLLRNRHTAQSRALWLLSPRRRYALTGTPQANQVQDLLPLLQWACGDGTARQPYGWYHPYLEPRLLQSMDHAERGLDAFMRRHAVFEWVTHEWEDELRGAKRQVPKVNDVAGLRAWAAPLLLRRTEHEPVVAAHFRVPVARTEVVTVPWDRGHLAHYVRTADEFARWYRDAKRDAVAKGRGLNLAILLARVGAVVRACNYPQYVGAGTYGIAPYPRLTSKQRAVLDCLAAWTEEGHKSICYVDGPGQAGLLAAALRERGIEAVEFHGQRSIAQRTRELDERFRFGPAPVLVASLAVAQNGLNLWQADREAFLCRSWSASQERQAMARALRPQQRRPVEVCFFQLAGSIDEYMQQMVEMKADSADAAVDFLTPVLEDAEFLHMDRILDEFVARLAGRAGLQVHEFREQLALEAA